MKGVELTDKGLIVLKYADSIIRTYSTMTEELEAAGKGKKYKD